MASSAFWAAISSSATTTAMSSPWMRTRRLRSFRSETSWWASSTLQGWPGVGYWMSGTSKQVRIFTTPGTARASVRSMPVTRPFAMVLWRILATRAPWPRRSSVYMARPVTLS